MYSNLKAEMARKDITAADIAKKLGMATSTISSRFSGKSVFTLAEAREIRKILDVDITIDELFEEE